MFTDTAGCAVTSGPLVVTSDSEGNVTGFTTSGHVIDMYQVLA